MTKKTKKHLGSFIIISIDNHKENFMYLHLRLESHP